MIPPMVVAGLFLLMLMLLFYKCMPSMRRMPLYTVFAGLERIIC